MDKDELYYLAIDLLKKLISIPRYSRDETKGADLVEEFLRNNLTNQVVIVRHGNNILVKNNKIDSSRPTVLLNSHIDTVKPVSGWRHDPHDPIYINQDDKLFGLGSNDAGASLVSLLAAFMYFTVNAIPCSYNLQMLVSAEEEVSGKDGIESMLPYLDPIDFAIVGEPTMMEIGVAEKGLVVIDGEVRGIAGHAARDEGENAIYKAIPIIKSIGELSFPVESEWLGKIKINVTQIEAGTQHNVIPDSCRFVIDMRTIDTWSNEKTFEYLKTVLPSYTQLQPRSLRLNPSSISLNNPVVKRLQLLGKKPFGSPTLSDQALMPWPSMKIGPGNSSRSHTSDEFVHLYEIRDAIETYIKVLF